MAAVSDAYQSTRAGFALATGFAVLLFAGLLANLIFDPARQRLQSLDRGEYATAASGAAN
jgi:hypothetical protein